MFGLGNKKSKMTNTENEKDADAGPDQTQESNEVENTAQEQQSQPAVPEQPTPEQPTSKQWELRHPDWQRSTVLDEKNHNFLKSRVTNGVQIRQVGSEEWQPIQEYLFTENTKVSETLSGTVVSEVKNLIESLQSEIQRLVGEMEYTKTFTANQKTQIDQLYNENREYKDGIIVKFKEALTKAIIEQLDATDDKIARYEEGKTSHEELAGFCREFASDFRNVLQNRLDMTCFLPNPGDEVDLKKHKVLRTRKADHASQHKKIAVAIRYGYENEDGKIVRPAFVETYEDTTPPTVEQQSESTDGKTSTEKADSPESHKTTIDQETETSENSPTSGS